MDLSAIIKAIIAPRDERPSVELPSLQPGDRLIGRVLQLEADGRVLIDLGRFRALAQTAFDVQPGQILKLKVVNSGWPLHLRVEPTPPAQTNMPPRLALAEVLGADQQLLSRFIEDYCNSPASPAMRSAQVDETLRQTLMQIRTLLEPMVLDGSDSQLSQKLGNALDQSGLFYEVQLAEAAARIPAHQVDALLEEGSALSRQEGKARAGAALDSLRTVIGRDIKAQLIRLLALLSETDQQLPLKTDLPAKDIQFVRQSLERLLIHIQEQQGNLVQRSSPGETHQVISYCWPVRDQNRPVRLKIYYPHKGRPRGSLPHHRVALLLDMERLGPLRVDLVMLERSLHIDFYVRNKATRQLLERHSHAVREALVNKFDQISIAAHISEEKIKRFDQEDAIGAGVGRVDIQV